MRDVQRIRAAAYPRQCWRGNQASWPQEHPLRGFVSHDKTFIIWNRRILRQLYRQLHDHSHIVSDRVMSFISRDKTLIIRNLT